MRPNFFGLERQNIIIEKFTNSDSSEKPDKKSFLEFRILKISTFRRDFFYTFLHLKKVQKDRIKLAELGF